MIGRHLSIWEIAHRWRDVNPDKTDPTDLPLIVQDTLRYICRGVLDGYLALFEMVIVQTHENNHGSGIRSEIRPYFVDEHPAEIEACLYRKYDKVALNSDFIDADNFFNYCIHTQLTYKNSSLDFPSFWTGQVDAFQNANNIPKSLILHLFYLKYNNSVLHRWTSKFAKLLPKPCGTSTQQ